MLAAHPAPRRRRTGHRLRPVPAHHADYARGVMHLDIDNGHGNPLAEVADSYPDRGRHAHRSTHCPAGSASPSAPRSPAFTMPALILAAASAPSQRPGRGGVLCAAGQACDEVDPRLRPPLGQRHHDCLGHSPHGCADIRHYTVGRMGYGPSKTAPPPWPTSSAPHKDSPTQRWAACRCCTRPAQICNIDDPLGGLPHNRAAAGARPHRVPACKEAGVPIAWKPGRGYQVEPDGSIPAVLEIHRNTAKGKPRMKHHVVSQVGSRWVVPAVEAVPMVGVSTTTLSTHATPDQALVAAAKLDGWRPPGWCQATTSGPPHSAPTRHTARRRRRAQSSRPRPGSGSASPTSPA